MASKSSFGRWLPSDRKAIDRWLANLIEEVKVEYKDKLEMIMALHPPTHYEESAIGGHATASIADAKSRMHGPRLLPECKEPPSDVKHKIKDLGLHQPVQNLLEAILSDPEINMFFHEMFWQQFHLPGDQEGVKIVCWQEMILLINFIMTRAPRFDKSDLIGFPINVILNWPMATTAGFAAFLNDKVNKLFKEILNYWAVYLTTYDSAKVLNDDPRHGWFGEDAMEAMPNFAKEFKCNPEDKYYGFKSWDDFFTREFQDGIRPVDSPDDDSIVANACESAPFKFARDVRRRDFFWIKNQQYSLEFILNMNELANKFYGGTIYQAFLSATSYHRWHSPVSGTIYKTELVDGSYYSQTYNIQDDPAAPNMSQGYISHVAARGIVYIQADNPDIGLMIFVSIGMSEVSSNEIAVKEGQRIKKGDQLGMFHYGGSTHLLIFQPGVDVEFDLHGQEPGLHSSNIPVRAKIAKVNQKKVKK